VSSLLAFRPLKQRWRQELAMHVIIEIDATAVVKVVYSDDYDLN
jgi:hypothetical protein